MDRNFLRVPFVFLLLSSASMLQARDPLFETFKKWDSGFYAENERTRDKAVSKAVILDSNQIQRIKLDLLDLAGPEYRLAVKLFINDIIFFMVGPSLSSSRVVKNHIVLVPSNSSNQKETTFNESEQNFDRRYILGDGKSVEDFKGFELDALLDYAYFEAMNKYVKKIKKRAKRTLQDASFLYIAKETVRYVFRTHVALLVIEGISTKTINLERVEKALKEGEFEGYSELLPIDDLDSDILVADFIRYCETDFRKDFLKRHGLNHWRRRPKAYTAANVRSFFLEKTGRKSIRKPYGHIVWKELISARPRWGYWK